MTADDEYQVYGDRRAPEPPGPSRRPIAGATPACPTCGSHDFEDGFLEGTADSLLRYFVGPRSVGLFGVKRFGLVRRAVLARRCIACSRLDLFADDAE